MKKHKSSLIKFIVIFAFLAITACGSDDGNDNDNKTDIVDPIDENKFIGEVEWLKVFGGSKEDNALSVVETTDGGYAVAGYTSSIDGDIIDKTATDSDYWILKLTKDGSVSWSKTYGGSADDRAEKIIQTADGGYLLVGYSRSQDQDVSVNAGLQDYWVVKVNTTGEIQWEKSFGFPGIDRAFSVVQTKDKGYFITGFLDVTASGGEGNDLVSENSKSAKGIKHGVGEFWGIKLDSSGNKEWRRFFGGTNNDRSYDVIQTEDNGFLMIGSSESVDFDITDSKGSYDFWVLKVNSEGTKLWQKSYGGSEIDVGYAIASTGDGKFIIVGDSRSNDKDITNPKGNADLWMIQIDSNGNLLWQKSLGGTAFDTGRGIHKTLNGDFVITGNTRSNDLDLKINRGQSDLWNLIIDTTGNIKWQSSLGGSEAEYGESCIETSDKKIVVVGSSESSDHDIPSNKGSKDLIIVKYK